MRGLSQRALRGVLSDLPGVMACKLERRHQQHTTTTTTTTTTT
eukprot:CAMPEP_0171068032 /NCGR_PEP_ID=MMETSP0766_2-20121228/8334_1 /TAXON_ID=439317 /ORGANISM="Gambierdiscus australes, Strain CAWD 149" /LENGTH=42 /DNA_ID= /DNA_START= /DNA_END= /DNA_ORIENTATION=